MLFGVRLAFKIILNSFIAGTDFLGLFVFNEGSNTQSNVLYKGSGNTKNRTFIWNAVFRLFNNSYNFSFFPLQISHKI